MYAWNFTTERWRHIFGDLLSFLEQLIFGIPLGMTSVMKLFGKNRLPERMPEYGFSLTRIFPYTGKYRSEETHVLACFRQCSVTLYFNYFTVFCSNYYTIMECIKVNENIAINWVNLNNYLFCN